MRSELSECYFVLKLYQNCMKCSYISMKLRFLQLFFKQFSEDSNSVLDSNEDNNNANNTSHKNKKSRGNDRENGAEDQESNDANEAGIQN